MMKVLRLSGIKLALDENEELLAAKVAAILDISVDDIVAVEIIRKAIDARRNKPPHFVYVLKITRFHSDIKLPAELKEGFQLLRRWQRSAGDSLIGSLPRQNFPS